MIQFYENMKYVFLPIMQVTPEEYDQMVKTTREEWLERNIYLRVARAYARKE